MGSNIPWDPGLSMHDFVKQTVYFKTFYFLIIIAMILKLYKKYKETSLHERLKSFHCVKSVQNGDFPGPYFPVFGLNMERYSVSLRTQSKCRKIRTRKKSVFGHFSRSV